MQNDMSSKRPVNLLRKSNPTSFLGSAHEGQRVIGFARHATSKGVDAQIEAIRKYAVERRAVLVSEVVQTGGPSRIDRAVIAGLVDRKRECRDFDAIIVTDASRLSRCGPADALAITIFLSLEHIALVSCDLVSGKPATRRVTGHE